MQKQNTLGVIGGLLLSIVICIAGVPIAWNSITGANSVRRAQLATQRAEYQMMEARAQATAEEARIEQIRAEGERAIFESAARANDNNTDLVDYFARREDTWKAIGIAAVLLIVSRLWQPGRPVPAATPAPIAVLDGRLPESEFEEGEL